MAVHSVHRRGIKKRSRIRNRLGFQPTARSAKSHVNSPNYTGNLSEGFRDLFVKAEVPGRLQRLCGSSGALAEFYPVSDEFAGFGPVFAGKWRANLGKLGESDGVSAV
jgi:hypothetical protein